MSGCQSSPAKERGLFEVGIPIRGIVAIAADFLLSRAGNRGPRATASPAFAAIVASWNL
jgi:hypothetical protein